MQAFREMVSGWLGKTLLMLLVVPFAFFGVYSYFGSGSSRGVAAEVNGQDIYQNDFDRAVDKQKQQLLSHMGANADASKIDDGKLHRDVMKSMVSQELLQQQARNDGFLVSDGFVAKLIQQEPAFKDENGKFSVQRYEQALRGAGEDPVSFPAKAKRQIGMTQLVGGLTQSSFALNGDVTRLAALDGQKRDLHLAMLNAANFMSGLSASDAEVKQYYDANPARFTTEETVNLDYIQLSRDDFLAKVTVTDDDIQSRYAQKVKDVAQNEQRHAQHILITVDPKVPGSDAAALKKIQDIEKQARAGVDFGTLAKANSQDPGSMANGGDLGFAGRGQFVPEFEKVLFSLQPNQVSAPVKTQFGYHLIKLLEIRQTPAPALADVRPELEQEARQAKADELYSDTLEKLDSAVYEASDLKDPAAKFGLSVQNTGAVTRHGAATGIASNAPVLKVAFSDDLVKDGKNSSAIKLSDTNSVWVHVRNYQPARLQPLAEATPQARLLVTTQKASAKAKAAADAAVKDLLAGKALADVATAYQLTWQDMPAADHHTQLDPKELKAAFTLMPPADGKISAQTVTMGDNTAIVAVSKVVPGTALPTGPELTQMASVVGETVGQFEVGDYLQYLRDKAKVKINDKKADTAPTVTSGGAN